MDEVKSDKKCFISDCKLSCSICPTLKQHIKERTKMVTKTAVSKYCEECLKFSQKKCKGRHPSQSFNIHWGIKKPQNRSSGLHFCKEYEFDICLYRFKDGTGEVETIKHVRKRQVKRDKEVLEQETANIVDIGMNLSSKDFVGLI